MSPGVVGPLDLEGLHNLYQDINNLDTQGTYLSW